jgi:hypothetical protein
MNDLPTPTFRPSNHHRRKTLTEAIDSTEATTSTPKLCPSNHHQQEDIIKTNDLVARTTFQ